MAACLVEFVLGGHVYYSPVDEKWVAIGYVKTLGRYPSKDSAIAAVRSNYDETLERLKQANEVEHP